MISDFFPLIRCPIWNDFFLTDTQLGFNFMDSNYLLRIHTINLFRLFFLLSNLFLQKMVSLLILHYTLHIHLNLSHLLEHECAARVQWGTFMGDWWSYYQSKCESFSLRCANLTLFVWHKVVFITVNKQEHSKIRFLIEHIEHMQFSAMQCNLHCITKYRTYEIEIITLSLDIRIIQYIWRLFSTIADCSVHSYLECWI